MPFNNSVVGGTVLVRNAIQSQNYSAGVSGWHMTRDGNVEFNTGTFRGSLSAGSNPGQHFIVSNPSTGDALDVYDSANHLIFAITNQGLAASYTTGTAPQPSVGFQNAQLIFSDNATPTAHQATMSFTAPSVPAAQGQITILNSAYTSDVGAIEVICGSADGTKRSTVQAIERGHQGSVLVSDHVSTNNLIHAASYSGTTNAAGHLVFNHGAGFTPTGAVVTGTAPGGTFANLTYGVDNLTSTQADVNWTVANTAAAFANQVITFNMLLWG